MTQFLNRFSRKIKSIFKIVDAKGGREERIEADYLVGCDGGRSKIRRALGIQYEGVFSQGMNVAVLFRSPLLAHSHGPAVQYQIINLRSTAPSLPSTAKSYGV